MFPSASCQMTSKIASAGASAKAILTSPWGSPSRSRSSPSARWDGWWTVGSARGRGSRWWAPRSAGLGGACRCSFSGWGPRRGGSRPPPPPPPAGGGGGGGGGWGGGGGGGRRGGGGGGA